MKRFYYFLQDNPNYPEMMVANSKAEVKSLILENIGEDMESSILNILTEEEFNGTVNGSNPEFQNPDDFKSGNDFFDSIIKGANKKLVKEAANYELPIPKIVIDNESVCSGSAEPGTTIDIPIKYFEAGGEQFKMDHGKIYKKVWREVENLESYRIVNSTTLKPIKSEKYKIENLVWEEVE